MYSKDLIEKVRELYNQNKNIRETSRILNINYSTVNYMIKNDYARVKIKPGPKKIIKNRLKTRIKRQAKIIKSKNQKVTANKIKNNCDIDASLRTVQRALSELGLTYNKIPKKLPLTKAHKQKRVECARKWIAENLISQNVVFSDEKRFKFDGPDNWCSWFDPFDPPIRVKRQMGGGGIMVWGMTLPNGEIYVEKLEGKVDSIKYISLLKYKVKPHLILKYPNNNFLFQQDNCKIHISKATTQYLKSAQINTFEWPSMSPDMNIQENIWQLISEIVYDQQQYNDNDLLWEAIKKAVNEINSNKKDMIKNIYTKYNSRLLKVIDNKGNEIPY